jgi:HK97 family phage major capsid protein
MPDDVITQRLRTRLGRAKAERRSLLDDAQRELRSELTEDETRKFTELTADINTISERLEDLADQEARNRRTNAAYAGVRQSSHYGGVYGPESRSSYVADIVAAARGMADMDARQPLEAHAMEQRDLSRADGAGGLFVPPAWLINEFVGVPRPGRVTADLLTRRDLPPGTDSINVPKLVTGTSTAIQPADNDPVQEVDLTDSVLTAPVRTIAGQQDVALQLLDQSPVNFDEIVLRDLLADYAQKLNVQVLSGSGTAGQHTGLRNVSGSETVTFTSASPTVPELVKRIADASQRISSAIYASPNAVVMHPRRWAWVTSQTDSTGRPYVVPASAGPSNAPGLVGAAAAEGRVGELAGLPVYVDGSLPTNLGAGVNEDLVLVLNTAETYLYESTIRTRVMPETLSGTLTVRIQLYAYSAIATRQGKSVAKIGGTGLVPPLFT